MASVVTDAVSLALRIGAANAPSPPLVRGLPVLGNLLDWLTGPHAFFLRSRRRYGPVFRYELPGRTHYVLAGAEANLALAKLDQAGVLSAAPIFRDFVAELGSENMMLGADGQTHRDLRRAFKGGMSRAVMEAKAEDASRIVHDKVARLAVGQRIDAMAFCRRLICDQLGDALAENTITEAQYDDIALIMRTLLEVTVVKRWPRVMLRWPAYRAAVKRALDLSRKLVDQHRPAPADPDQGNLIHDLVRALDTGVVHPRDMVMIALTPYFAGLDTVSGTLGFAMYALLSDPDLYQRVRGEVDSVAARDGKIGAEALREMPLIRGTVMETLRLYPTAVVTIRITRADFVAGGYHIPQGSELVVPFTTPHWMEEYFPEPHKFDIDRYSKERAEHKQPGAYAPFSAGHHTCLGAGLAEVLTAVDIANLLAHVELRLEPGYVLKKRYVPLAAPRGMRWEVVRQRKAASLRSATAPPS
jgi:cytochrome P450